MLQFTHPREMNWVTPLGGIEKSGRHRSLGRRPMESKPPQRWAAPPTDVNRQPHSRFRNEKVSKKPQIRHNGQPHNLFSLILNDVKIGENPIRNMGGSPMSLEK